MKQAEIVAPSCFEVSDRSTIEEVAEQPIKFVSPGAFFCAAKFFGPSHNDVSNDDESNDENRATTTRGTTRMRPEFGFLLTLRVVVSRERPFAAGDVWRGVLTSCQQSGFHLDRSYRYFPVDLSIDSVVKDRLNVTFVTHFDHSFYELV